MARYTITRSYVGTPLDTDEARRSAADMNLFLRTVFENGEYKVDFIDAEGNAIDIDGEDKEDGE